MVPLNYGNRAKKSEWHLRCFFSTFMLAQWHDIEKDLWGKEHEHCLSSVQWQSDFGTTVAPK